MATSLSFNRLSFDVRAVLDDDRRRLLKKYRETKKKGKLLLRRQADQGLSHCPMVSHSQPTVLEILTLLDTFTYATDARTTLIDELIYESRRFYPSFES